MKLAGLTPAAVICEIINEDGTMSRRDELAKFSKEHNVSMVKIKDLIEYRIRHEVLIEADATSTLPMNDHGNFDMTVFKNQLDDAEHFALVKKPTHGNKVPLVRIHSECITGDVFGSCRCDCGSQLQKSLELISNEGGLLIYLRQEGRGIGLANKLKAYALQDKGFDTVDANIELGLPVDARDYAVAYQILKHFGVDVIRLLTNNPKKVDSIEKYGIHVSERVALSIKPTQDNLAYLMTKKEKLGHLLVVE
jgi:3,4-dihydroxy 2-butanone 4-phosphate synthase/GTP cyclohydrolase II